MATQVIENGVYTNLPSYNIRTTRIGNSRIGDPSNPASDLETGDTASKLINVVEIDWNGAQLSPSSHPIEGLVNSSVNTTGQLLQNIENLQAQVNILTTLVKGLYNALEA